MKLPRLDRSPGLRALGARGAGRSTALLVPSGACGTGWNERLVPDRLGAADFTSACRAHDACYETCGASKSACDSRFRGDLLSECRDAYSAWWQAPRRSACFGAAEGYALAVHAYRAAQRATGC